MRRPAVITLVVALLLGIAAPVAGAAASASAMTATSVSIAREGASGFVSTVSVSSSVSGKWEYRLVATDGSTVRSTSMTIGQGMGSTGTFRLSNLPAAPWRVTVEERVWGVESSVVVIADQYLPIGLPAPSTLTATPQASGDVLLSWDRVAGLGSTSADGYLVEWGPNASTGYSGSLAVDSSTASLVVTGLQTGSLAKFRVKTRSTQGSFGAAQTATTPILPPDKPVVRRADPLSQGARVTLDLFETASRPIAMDGVTFEYAATGDGIWRPATVVRESGTLWRVDGLTDGTTYELRVTSRNGVGSSAVSDVVAVTPVGRPAAPVLGAPVRGISSITVPVTAMSTPAAPVDALEWQLSEVSNGTAVAWTAATPSATGTGVSFSNLVAGLEYAVRAHSVNASGPSAWATSSNVRVIARPADARLLAVTPLDGGLSVSADFAPSDAQPSDGSQGLWQVSVDAGASWRRVPVVADGASWRITGLSNGETYQVRVRAANDVGISAPSNVLTGTPFAPPATPVLGAVEVGNRALGVVQTAVSTPAAPVQHLTWEIQIGEDTSPWLPVTPASLNDRALFTNLTAGEMHRVRVRAENDVAVSAWATTGWMRAMAEPVAPQILQTTAMDGGIAIVAALESSEGRPADLADARWEVAPLDDPTAWTPASRRVTATGVELTGLVNGTDYVVRVVADNAYGSSAWVQSPTTVRPIAAPDVPSLARVFGDPASVVTATEVAGTDARPVTAVEWQVRRVDYTAVPAGRGDGSRPPSAGRHAVVAAPSGEWVRSLGAWTTVPTTTVNGRTTLLGLVDGVSYQVRVVARNPVGQAFSSPSSDVTPVGTPSAPVVSRVVAVDAAAYVALAATATVAQPVSAVRWQIAASSDASGPVWRTVGAQEMGTVTLADGSALSGAYRFGGLTNGADYLVRARFTNASGVSAWTAAIAFTPARGSNAVTSAQEVLTGGSTGPTSTRPVVIKGTATSPVAIASSGATVVIASAAARSTGPVVASRGAASSSATGTVIIAGNSASAAIPGGSASQPSATAGDAEGAATAEAAPATPDTSLVGTAQRLFGSYGWILGALGALAGAIRFGMKRMGRRRVTRTATVR